MTTAELTSAAPPSTVVLKRMHVDGVVEAPNGAHFTSCVPDYEADKAFLDEYVASAADGQAWDAFRKKYLAVDEVSREGAA